MRSEINLENQSNFVTSGNENIAEFCISCWSRKIECPHPFFEGSLCYNCKDFLLESVFMIDDDDGSYSYCTICGNGGNLFLCEGMECKRVYCKPCMQFFYSEQQIEAILKSDEWRCELCCETENFDCNIQLILLGPVTVLRFFTLLNFFSSKN